MTPKGTTESASAMRGWELGLLALIALMPRLAHLDAPPYFDEVYHILAARSWAAEGTFALADGVYTRAAGFTTAIALLFKVAGESLVVARVPAVMAGTLLVVVVGWWTGRTAGRTAGWIAALLVAIDPGAIYVSQIVRFYAPHALFVFLATAGLFLLADQWSSRPAWWRGLLSAGILALLGAAGHLQVTTLVTVTGLGLWGGGVLFRWWWQRRRKHPAWRWLPIWVAALLLAAVVGLAATGLAAQLWNEFRSTALWARADASEPRFYKWVLESRYPVFFSLLPVSILLAWRYRPRVAVFAAVMFSTAFLLHSLAAIKAERYLFHAIPFFHILTGIALTAILPAMRTLVADVAAAFLPMRAGLRLHVATRTTILVILAAVLAASTPVLATTRRMLLADEFAASFPRPHWNHAAARLRPVAESASVVITSALPKAIYYLQRGEVTLSLTQLGEVAPRNVDDREFAVDYRTGRPTISTVGSLEALRACHRSGLIVVEAFEWRKRYGTTPEVADYLEQHMAEVPLPEAWRLHVFSWEHGADWTPQPCPASKTGRVPVREPRR
jgi:hypothetical protein